MAEADLDDESGTEVHVHVLSVSEEEKRRVDTEPPLQDFLQQKLERQAQKNWDYFYKRNSTHFFKDRHWLMRDFPELLQLGATLLEIGCGVGNTVYPLLKENPSLFVHACDFAPKAIDMVKKHECYTPDKVNAFVYDLTLGTLPSFTGAGSVDFVTAIFVLSAMSPDTMPTAIASIFQTLKPGGIVLMRDYGLYDAAMMRFKTGQKISENFYMRHDMTRAYYFSEDVLRKLFADAGFEILECSYVSRELVNVKREIHLPRTFIQAKFRRPV